MQHVEVPTTAGPPIDGVSRRLRVIHSVSLGLLALTFVVSALLSLFDPSGTEREFEELGYPGWIGTYPLGIAKLVAVAVLLQRRWPVLRVFAWAALLFDLVLALMAHVHEGDFPQGWLAVYGLAVWVVAFVTDRIVNPLTRTKRPLRAA